MSKVDRLEQIGWSSFRAELFLGEPGRVSRNVGPQILSILRDFSLAKSVLELCCGAGKLCIEMARAGYIVTGIDLSEEMLSFARRAAAAEADEVRHQLTFANADVCAFRLADRFDFIILEDDGFVYLLERTDQLACLQQVQSHLKDDGKFFLSFPTPQLELADAGGFEYDSATQIKSAPCVWKTVEQDGKRSSISEGFERRRLTYQPELEELLTAARLKPVARWGDLDRTPFTDPCRQEYCYLCQRA